jgi:SapC
MSLGLSIYEKPVTPTPAHGDMRIFAPIAYPAVRRAQMVPIVHLEAIALAAWFPICWFAGGQRPTLVVLRTLHADGSRQPAGSPNASASLPLMLKAYPFVAGQVDPSVHGSWLLIDDVVADQPTDVGAPMLMPDRQMGRGTEMRMRAVSAFNQALPLTEAMTDALLTHDCLEPWALEVQIGSDLIKVPDLLVIRGADFRSSKIFRFIKEFGPVGASFLGAHRISLFRAGVLSQVARAPARPEPAPPHQLELR